MLKQLMFALLILCGLPTNAFAGAYALGSNHVTSVLNTPTKSVWGIAGYILVSPVSLNTAGHGVLYHTHANASARGYETIMYYGENGDIRLKAFSWAYSNNYLSYPVGPVPNPTPPQWQATENDVVIAANGTWSAGALKYLTNITIGTETKKAIYFENVSFFTQYAGTTTGAWREFIRIKDFGSQTMVMKWAQKWDGTKAENSFPGDNGHNKWAGALETFNYDNPGSGTPYNSSGTASVGNAGMAFINRVGLPQAMDSVSQSIRLTDTVDSTGLVVYSPGGANAFAWLAHVP